jgi:hypothetical protein
MDRLNKTQKNIGSSRTPLCEPMVYKISLTKRNLSVTSNKTECQHGMESAEEQSSNTLSFQSIDRIIVTTSNLFSYWFPLKSRLNRRQDRALTDLTRLMFMFHTLCHKLFLTLQRYFFITVSVERLLSAYLFACLSRLSQISIRNWIILQP